MTSIRHASIIAIVLAVAAVGSIPAVGLAAQADEGSFFRAAELGPNVAMSGTQFYIPNVFGPTGMNGWILGETLVVREVESGSPADGIVLPNDIIHAVNGKPLGAEPLKTLGRQVDVSEQTGKMSLLVKRGTGEKTLTIPIRKLGPLGKDWPYESAKSRAIHVDACEYLARNQNVNGLFDGRIYVGFALNGLTWLAADDPKYMENARRLAYGYRRAFDPEKTNTVNWEWGYMGVFLAEYFLQTGDRCVLPLAQAVGQTIARSQLPCGTWGHGPFPGRGYVQGGALNNCGLVCWMALVLLDEAGVPVNQPALNRSTKFFERFAFRGGVPYGDHRPEFGGGNGKNALPGIVANILGDQAASEYYARLVTGSFRGRNGGHTGGFMGFIWGNVQGAQDPHYSDYRRMLDYWGWLLNVSRRWDGGFLVPESIIGKIYTYRGPMLATGGLAQLYAMPNRALRIHGGLRSVFAKQDLPAELAKGVLLYRDRKFDELRKSVKPTSSLARQLLAAADRKEKDITLTLDKIETAMNGGNLALASQMANDLSRLTYNGRDIHRLGALRWQIRIHKDAGTLANARELYERNKWLTYTDAEARQVFEKLAADPKAGIYQQLARQELATPDDASLWTYYCELIYTKSLPIWRIDSKAKAAMLRASSIRSGNWPKISALNLLQDVGVLAEQLKDWTPLVAPWTGDYPGPKPTWRYTSAAAGQGPPANWAGVDFDDSSWEKGRGPLGGDGGIQPRGGTPYIRIAFDCDRVDFKKVLLGLRTRGKAALYLNGSPVLWSDATQGPRMRMKALVMIDLTPNAMKLLRKGRNVLAIRALGGRADFGMYASPDEPVLGYKPRPKDWTPGPQIAPPDLSTKTPGRPILKTVLPPCTTGLTFDPPGKPNKDLDELRRDFVGIKDQPALGTMSLARRAQYLGHFDSRIRRDAAYSLMGEGAKAMPYILKALESKDVRVIRGGCDAIGGKFGMNGLGRGNKRSVMTPDIAGQAVPKLLPLLKHPDMYVREGALMALSNCGKAAARHLDEIVACANDDDWWVRAGVAYVLRYVQEPQTGRNAAETIKNFLAEKSVFGRNRFRNALTAMAKRGDASDAIVKALIEDSRSEDGFNAGMAVGALGEIGPNAKAALPIFQEKLAKAKANLAKATDSGKKKQLEKQVRKWQGVISRTNPAAAKPAKAKTPRKKRK